jgi:RNA polymerase sigma factor (sigma-70 family)
LDRKPDAEGKLYLAIIDFATGKISGDLFDSPECSADSEDYAQEVAIRIWEKMHTFSGDPSSFYPWLHRICYTKGIQAYTKTTEESSKKVPLVVEVEDSDGLEDNPLIYKEQKPEHVRELPNWIQGVDRWICDLIREDMTYAQIGKFLHITEKAVRQRVARMKDKNLELAKNSGVVKRVRVKGKWIDAIPQNTKENNAKS